MNSLYSTSSMTLNGLLSKFLTLLNGSIRAMGDLKHISKKSLVSSLQSSLISNYL